MAHAVPLHPHTPAPPALTVQTHNNNHLHAAGEQHTHSIKLHRIAEPLKIACAPSLTSAVLQLSRLSIQASPDQSYCDMKKCSLTAASGYARSVRRRHSKVSVWWAAAASRTASSSASATCTSAKQAARLSSRAFSSDIHTQTISCRIQASTWVTWQRKI